MFRIIVRLIDGQTYSYNATRKPVIKDGFLYIDMPTYTAAHATLSILDFSIKEFSKWN